MPTRLTRGIAPGWIALHPIADDELGAVVELSHERGNLAEVVRQVGIDHDDVVAAGGGKPARYALP